MLTLTKWCDKVKLPNGNKGGATMQIQKLKAARVQVGYTQKQLAEKLGISSKSYNRKELGLIEFKSKEIIHISILLNLTLKNVNEIFFENKLPIV